MKKLLCIVLLVAAPLNAQQPPSSTNQQQQPPPPPPPWWLRLLRFAGVTATPSQQRGDSDPLASGEVWIRGVDDDSAARLLAGDYHSPIFGCGDRTVYALSGDVLYRVNAVGGKATPLLTNSAIQKLIGIDPNACNDALVLTKSNEPALLSLATQDFAILRVDQEADAPYLSYLRTEKREYDDAVVYSSHTDGVLNVMLKKGHQPPRQLTSCKSSCLQPSLSHDRESIVYVRLR